MAVDTSHIPYMRTPAGLDADSFARLASRMVRRPAKDAAGAEKDKRRA